jgi:hypothetical protein
MKPHFACKNALQEGFIGEGSSSASFRPPVFIGRERLLRTFPSQFYLTSTPAVVISFREVRPLWPTKRSREAAGIRSTSWRSALQ